MAVLGTARDKRETINGVAYRTESYFVVDTRFGPVLVTRSYPPDSLPYCNDCLKGVGVAYLREKGSWITARRRWPLVWPTGANAKRGELISNGSSLNDQLTTYPLIGVRSSRSSGNAKCPWVTYIELRPEGPMDRGTIYVRARPGWYANVERDHSFDIVVDGTDIRDHYELRNGHFVGPSPSQLKC
ncbi:hypothetical protein GCM10022280_22220 [Sphingomonas swuensis]|uniref:Uncharacterized protein n=1 Tax=Sphingomonas swuensis TaxID=977800 RepID=A0ABP7T712_9SPHN